MLARSSNCRISSSSSSSSLHFKRGHKGLGKSLWIISVFEVVILSLIYIQSIDSVSLRQDQDTNNEPFYERPGIRPSEILKARGFLAEEKYFRTKDNYVIRMTHGWNPMIENSTKLPILFVHGVLEADNVFLINSFGARPRDLSQMRLGGDDSDELEQMLADDPSAKSLPLLALNFGHEVWIMSRRGFPGSQELIGDMNSIPAGEERKISSRQNPFSLTSGSGPITSSLAALFDYGSIAQQLAFSFDRKFWNFSFDEQAKYDFPQACNFVLKHSKWPKLSVVTHSAGGAIQLMALSLKPELANKIESSILWSQGFSLGHDDAFVPLQPALPFLEFYIGSIPPAFSTTQIQAIAGLICAAPLSQSTICEGVADLLLGQSGGQEPIRPEFVNSLLYPTASHELAQNLQMVPYGRMRAYNYGPFYNLSAVQLETMSFYVGATDITVSPADVRATLPLLRVPYKFHMIDTTFNHNGYFYHNDNARLAIIPSLKEIHQFSSDNTRS